MSRALLWERLISGIDAALIERATAIVAAKGPTPADIAKLRAIEPDAQLVAAALELAQARAKLAAKWGPVAAHLFADKPGAEMASSLPAAAYKAARMAEFGLPLSATVLDGCCGVGADSLGLAARGLSVCAVDIDPARCAMARANLTTLATLAATNTGTAAANTIECRCADVLEPAALAGATAMYMDPARRTGTGGPARRLFKLDDIVPSIADLRAVWSRLVSTSRGSPIAAIKLGPGTDLDELSATLSPSAIEIISERGQLTQCVAWLTSGQPPAAPVRSAILLHDDPTSMSPTHALATLRDGPREPSILRADATTLPEAPTAPLSHFVYDPDDAIERAGLLGELCRQLSCHMPHSQCGLLTSPQLIDSPWLTAFEVLAESAWSSRQIAAQLAAVIAGEVEVKTRGNVVDADALTKQLRSSGSQRVTLFVIRFGDQGLRAIIARRLPRSH